MRILFAFLFSFFLFSCQKKEANISATTFEFTGLIQAQSATTYMYGNYTITEGSQTYVLQSQTIDLSKFLGKTATVSGNLIGCIISGGPQIFDVVRIKVQ